MSNLSLKTVPLPSTTRSGRFGVHNIYTAATTAHITTRSAFNIAMGFTGVNTKLKAMAMTMLGT